MKGKFEAMRALVFEEIEKMIHSSKMFLFIKGSPCQPRCKFTRRLLEALGGGVEGMKTLDILEKPVFRSWVPFYSDWPTFPQVFVNGKFVGGVDVVTEMIENEEFVVA